MRNKMHNDFVHKMPENVDAQGHGDAAETTSVVHKGIEKWADAVDGEASDDGDEVHFQDEEGEVHVAIIDTNVLVPFMADNLLGKQVVEALGQTHGMQDMVVHHESSILPLDEMNQVENNQVTTVLASPGGSVLLGCQGRVEVIFEDVVTVASVLEQQGGEFTTVNKRPPGRPPGSGNKKSSQMSAEETQLA
ncbi:hypothetical protein NE237_023685 [Protea cynaroides]|uniref:Uncharacterized protein n=1 Tax=Protea cynaroides TaxID=273540 RepID=A0A9Q0HEG1_9MAGN|nr:hypothetical protein NE237_023685 [Protea cynaroides]